MTVAELYDHVARLGFEDGTLEDDKLFYNAVERAILQVGAIRPAISTCTINHLPPTNYAEGASFDPVEKPYGGEISFYGSDVRAFYFRCNGIGTAYVEAEDGTGGWQILDTVDMDSNARYFFGYRGFFRRGTEYVTGQVRIRFTGTFLYSVSSVAMYRDITAGSADDIPAYEPYTRYDLSKIAPDFVALKSAPIRESDGYSPLTDGYQVESGNVVLLPYDKTGLYTMLYRRRPAAIERTASAVDDETVIDLDDELCAILPLLVAVYCWLDDDPDKANFYMALYSSRAAEIKEETDEAADYSAGRFISVNNW